MTEDHPETDSAVPGDPDSEVAVRRLLADARVEEPMPADVAARMDDVLAGLAGSTVGAPPGSAARSPQPVPATPTVTPLAPHRRRRAAALLVAAAAIVVGGVVVAQQLPSPHGAADGASAAGSAAEDRGSALNGNSGDDSQNTGNSPGPQVPGTSTFSDGPSLKALVRHGRVVVRPDRFSSDALAARRLLRQHGSAYDAMGSTASTCAVLPAGADAVRATYQRAPAVLVFHRPVSNSQVVDLFICGTSRPVRSATLPHP